MSPVPAIYPSPSSATCSDGAAGISAAAGLDALFRDVTPDAAAVGRFAPSPTGRMHLGNVYAALMSWLSVKSRGGRWLLRIEDIDTQRSRREWTDWLMDDLCWLGLKWDGEPCFQSARGEIYYAALRRLGEQGLLYPCRCTRQELQASRAPHQSDGHIVYGGRCRPEAPVCGVPPEGETLRLMVPVSDSGVGGVPAPFDEQVFVDELCGPQRVLLSRDWGDFVVRRRDGAWAYQLAVAVDDALTGVNEVVRGDDLLLSTAVQRYVQQRLALPQPRRYAHLPLLRNADGQRLSKRDGSLAMDHLRAHAAPADVLVRVCRLAGIDADAALALVGL